MLQVKFATFDSRSPGRRMTTSSSDATKSLSRTSASARPSSAGRPECNELFAEALVHNCGLFAQLFVPVHDGIL